MNQESTNNNAAGLLGVLPAGAKLGKYEIVERLGSGGQSIVYKGYDPLLDRHVAIKQIVPQLATEDKFTKRFREVARQLASLGCEQVVTLYELMEENGGLFVVMEFVEGHTIETTLADHPEPIDPKAALQIVWRIASGLTAIHKVGIVHRDIKPGNIIIGEGLRVKITDFGVAAKAGAAVSMKLGTTKYMAPELFAAGEVDGRSDIYSLGMIAYEMLLGREKFDEVFHDVVRDPHSEALRWMKWHSSPEQVATPLAEINPDIPKALSVTVAKMLAKEPDERFANIEELGKVIRANFSPRAHHPRKRRGKKHHTTGTEGVVLSAREEKEAPAIVDTSGPATAAIPKESMSLRKKLAIIGTIVGIVIVGLIVFWGMDSAQQKKIGRQASDEYRVAEELYKEAGKAEKTDEKKAEYTTAAEAFVAIHKNKQYARQVIKKQAEVREHFCRAYLAALDGDWDNAHSHKQLAGDLTKQLQRDYSYLDNWTQKIEQQLRDLETYLNNYMEYVKTVEQVRKSISDGELEQAKKHLENAKRRAVLDEHKARLQSLLMDISVMEKMDEYRRHDGIGDAMAEAGDVNGAIKAWDDALVVLEEAKGLTRETYSSLKQNVEQKKTALITETNYATAMDEATKAEEAKNLLVAADAYEKAAKIKPAGAEALLTKAGDLRHDHHLQLGRQHLAANKLSAAEDELNKAKSYKASSEVETELKKIRQVKGYKSLLGQGNRAFQQKKYRAALEKYQAASEVSSDAELQGKITDCRYQITMGEAETHRVKAEWVEAEAAYNKARQIKSSASAEIDACLELLRQDRAYAEHLAAAKRALKRRDLKGALVHANGARDIRATPEVEQIIKQARYEQQVTLGKEAMGREDYNSAVAYFKQAKRVLATPEIDKLIDQAEKLKAASPGDS